MTGNIDLASLATIHEGCGADHFLEAAVIIVMAVMDIHRLERRSVELKGHRRSGGSSR